MSDKLKYSLLDGCKQLIALWRERAKTVESRNPGADHQVLQMAAKRYNARADELQMLVDETELLEGKPDKPIID